ncbi:hypothetical protein ACGFIF_14285 [Kribbella sp. NPDC049174]|uniref:hypothetical protein n=1 Tax=Kribbella sp. NPDC049174 TaxID=3364112 RepID=UPI0037165243
MSDTRPLTRRLLLAALASDLLLRDAAGNLVIDEDWGEPLLDLRTQDKRNRIAQKGDTLSIVRRDVDVSVPGDSGYVRKTC